MLDHIAILVLSFLSLIKGADFFIETSARLAKKLGVSEFIIGLTVTAVGTSLPELASSVSASIQGSAEIVMGNVVGSNIANIGLIIGISALLGKLKTEKKMYARDGYILILSVMILYFTSFDGFIDWKDGLVLIFVYVFYTLFLFKTKEKEAKDYKFHDFMQYMFGFKYIASLRSIFIKKALEKKERERTLTEKEYLSMFREGLLKDIFVLILSLAFIVVGANFLIDESVFLAKIFGINESLIGLTIISIGTSLPELTVSIAAVRKGHGELVIGNVLGSNIANIFFIVGVSSFIKPIFTTPNTIIYTMPIMGFFSLALTYFIKHNKSIEKKVGLTLISSYLIFLLFAFMKGF